MISTSNHKYTLSNPPWPPVISHAKYNLLCTFWLITVFCDVTMFSIEPDMHSNILFSRAYKVWQDNPAEAGYCATEVKELPICQPFHPAESLY